MNVSKLLFYLLVAILSIGVLQGLSIGGLFFFKRSGERRANYFYGLLLITFALTMLHHILVMTGFFERFPALCFLPLYFTLAFPTLLFYYVKLSLFPTYHFQRTDIKHFILPIGQFLFFMSVFFSSIEYKSHLVRHFFNPFYGALEQLLYLTTFFAYLFFASRYIKRKRKLVRERQELRQVLYMRVLVKILFILFCVHTAFVLSDFITFELFAINLRSVRLYAAAGVLSFAALLFWLGIYGFQVLFWGRKVFGKVRS
ncbi:MAG: hypothetical protein ACK4TA_26120 [Saprospiraceae bacterium]